MIGVITSSEEIYEIKLHTPPPFGKNISKIRLFLSQDVSAFTEVNYGHILSKDVSGGRRVLIWSQDVTGGHKGQIWSHHVTGYDRRSQMSNMVTPCHRMCRAVKEV